MRVVEFLAFFVLLVTIASVVLKTPVTEFDYSPRDITWPAASDWRR